MPRRLWMVGLSSLLATACSSSPGTQPPLAPCKATSGGQVSLGIGAYTVIDPTQTAGCAVFPSNPAGTTIEYLVVPQSASSIPDDSQAFKLGGNPLAAPRPPPPPASTLGPNVAQHFDLPLRLYETDTLAFGGESDIDNNGMVIVLMTGKVNALVTSAQCNSPTGGYVAGFFFGADLITTPPFATGNAGEIFYSIVPDPSGTLSCQHSVSAVTQLVPVTFVHEVQHMISFNQHFLVRGNFPEDLWLNEGVSHYAEENGWS